MDQKEYEKNLMLIINSWWLDYPNKHDKNLFENYLFLLIPKHKFSYDLHSRIWLLIK